MRKHPRGSHTTKASSAIWQALAEEHAHLNGDPIQNPADAAEVTAALHKAQRSALCLSGGGVRSAMFSLGVLQELARFSWKESEKDDAPRLLAEFDYLSTVSGGGYTGAWFTSWASRASTPEVIRELVRQPKDKLKPEPLPVEQVRSYASFLNPKIGMTSADSWTLGTTILRNIILNWLVLLPLLAAVLTIPRIIDAFMECPTIAPWLNTALLVAGFVTGACACFYMVNDLPSAGNARWSQKNFLIYSVGALALSGLCCVLYWRWNPNTSWFAVVLYTMAMVFTGTVIGAAACIPRVRRDPKRNVNPYWISGGIGVLLVCAAVGGFLTYRAALLFEVGDWILKSDRLLYTWLAYPCLFCFYGVFQLVLVGAASKMTEDEDREWWARCAAWFTMLMAAWILGMGLVLYANALGLATLHGILKLTGTTTLTGAILSLIGFSPKTTSGRKDDPAAKIGPPALPARLRELAVKLILPVFLLLLILTLSSINAKLSFLLRSHWIPLAYHRTAAEILNGVCLAAVGSIAAYRVNANKFSLNGMYRLRLIRTFLGASNAKRNPSPLTNFDEDDNIKMAKLREVKPFHIVNMALNVVKTSNLAWQQRKAESFTASPLHCGNMTVGYVDTERYSQGPNDPLDGYSGLSLGSAIAISGAAASPNMGYHSSPLLTIVMTLFNARLGAWLANPRDDSARFWADSTPEFALSPLVSEAFGLTTDTNRWVYLSDGGHFENLGLYEMVLRRCHSIVIIDAGADPDYSFEDLANAIRKIRVDMGIEIDFANGIKIFKKGQADGRHFAHGTIKYDCVDKGAPDGDLVYIKTSLNGNEPRDVLHYSAQNDSFPQQPTYDLWFDEAQLESYRRLGSHIIQEICGDSSRSQKLYSVADFVAACKTPATADHLTNGPASVATVIT